jgi:hypothetical protein
MASSGTETKLDLVVRALEAGDYDKGAEKQSARRRGRQPLTAPSRAAAAPLVCAPPGNSPAPPARPGFLGLLAQLTTVGDITRQAFEGELPLMDAETARAAARCWQRDQRGRAARRARTGACRPRARREQDGRAAPSPFAAAPQSGSRRCRGRITT